MTQTETRGLEVVLEFSHPIPEPTTSDLAPP